MKLLRFLLFPFAIIYDIITTLRNWFFEVGVLKSTSYSIPVIAVGNLSVGGTGKSPQIEYLIRLLKNEYKIAVLSRGYKRKTKGFQIINTTHATEDVGDEPMQFFKKFGSEVTVAVDTNRTNGIKQLLKSENPPKIVLLDDAFQHRKVKASTYILLTKFNDLYVDDFILPTGSLRESSRGAQRANIIIVTKCPDNLSEVAQDRIIRRVKPGTNQEVFFSRIDYDENLGGNTPMSISDLKNSEVLLVTGIANPSLLLSYLSERQINFKHLQFPDHHNFSTADVTKIKNEFQAISSDNKCILTTEKDFVRLENKIDDLQYVSIKNDIIKNEEVFNLLIFSKIKNKSF